MNDLAHPSIDQAPEREGEIGLLFERIHAQYGFDFRHYSAGYLRRRIERSMSDHRLATVAELQALVLRDPAAMAGLVETLTIYTTSLFRDPDFYRTVRQEIVPWLATYPFARIWVAGCSTGEEAYSLAILLREAGIHSRCLIYATDFNETILARAKAGVFPLTSLAEYEKNYEAAGALGSLSDYYVTDGRDAMMIKALKERIVFAQHNLVCDGSFNEFHAIFCRNVMIYFSRDLQDRVRDLLTRSLIARGFLGVGSGESLSLSSHQHLYEEVANQKRIYRKVKGI